MENVQSVIFDMDGLMFDTERVYFQSNRQALAEMGIDYTMEDYLDLVGTSGSEFKSIMMQYLANDQAYIDFLTRADQIFLSLIEEGHGQVKEGLYELLDYLDDQGIKKSIVSSSNRQVIDILVSQAGLELQFDQIIAGDQVQNKKPHPEPFLKAWQGFNIPKETTWILEDSVTGLKAANAAAIKAILVPDLIVPSQEAHQRAHRIFRNLRDVKNYFMTL